MKKYYIFLGILVITGIAFRGLPTFPQQLEIIGGEIQSSVVDDEAIEQRNVIIKELKMLNIYMSKITGETFTESDIE